MSNLCAVLGNPVCVIREALDDIDRFILAREVHMPDDPLRALTSLYKLVEGVDKVVIERAQRLMFSIRLRFPVHEMRLIPSPEAHRDKLFDHYITYLLNGVPRL